MIYLDTSVALAQLLAEERLPSEDIWSEPLVSSRLLEYETWTRIHARGLAASHGALVQGLLARLSLVELAPEVLARAIEPFPTPVRTLDALHLSTIEFLRSRRLEIGLATLDRQQAHAAAALGIPLLFPL